jgi:O-antigen/teichoic acid export membrane protein
MRVYGIAARLSAILMHDGEFAAVIRGAGLALVIRVPAGVVGYVTAILLARWMGSSEYGCYSFAVAAMTLLAYPATLGLPGAAVRFAAQYATARDWPHVAGLLVMSSWLGFGCSAVIALVGVPAILYFKAHIDPGYVAPMIVALAGLPVVAVSMVRSEAIRGLGWLALAWGPLQLGQPLLFLIVAVAIMFIATELSASMVVGASIAASAAMLIAQWGVLRARLGTKISVPPKVNIRLWLGVALSFVWISVANIVLAQAGIIMVGVFLTPKEVAIFSAAAATSLLMTYPLQATNALSVPKFAALHAQQRHVELQTLVTNVTRWTFWPSLAIALLLGSFGSTILRLFGPGFEQGYAVLVILTIGQLANAFAGPVANLLSMTGHQVVTAWAVGCSAILYVLVGILAIPVWGALGAGIAFCAITLLWNFWLMILVMRKLEIYPSILSPSVRAGRTDSGVSIG